MTTVNSLIPKPHSLVLHPDLLTWAHVQRESGVLSDFLVTWGRFVLRFVLRFESSNQIAKCSIMCSQRAPESEEE